MWFHGKSNSFNVYLFIIIIQIDEISNIKIFLFVCLLWSLLLPTRFMIFWKFKDIFNSDILNEKLRSEGLCS